jgi:hypothetical protein
MKDTFTEELIALQEDPMVQVHHFKVWNINKGDWEIPKRTAESIAELKGHILPNTGVEVDPTQLDDQGRYFPHGRAFQVDDAPVVETDSKKKPK